jgi:cation diffusion facilitator CzcD-associated flavoprotein CzcO
LRLNFRVLEKNPDLGGTWWSNKYPGVACDVWSIVYQVTKTITYSHFNTNVELLKNKFQLFQQFTSQHDSIFHIITELEIYEFHQKLFCTPHQSL